LGASGKWPQILLSRTCDKFLIRLFEIEVPEIFEGIVQLVGVAREPGVRAKVGVRSLDKNVDPVGACVGMRGARIQSIVRELRGEKIDIIEWSDDPAVFVARAITPAKVQSASVNSAEKAVNIVVDDDQLALAIGKRGQNAKLAVRLTKWKINILSASERKIAVQQSFDQVFTRVNDEIPDSEREAREDEELKDIVLASGLAEDILAQLRKEGFFSCADVMSSSLDELTTVLGIDEGAALMLLDMARQTLQIPDSDMAEVRTDE